MSGVRRGIARCASASCPGKPRERLMLLTEPSRSNGNHVRSNDATFVYQSRSNHWNPLPEFNAWGLTKISSHLSMFRFRGTTLCIGEDADGKDSLPLATGAGDRRSWTARGVCIDSLTDPSTSRRCALAGRRLGGRKIEQGESRSASHVMFHTKVRCSGHVRPTDEGRTLPVHKPFFVSPNACHASSLGTPDCVRTLRSRRLPF